MKKSEFIEKCFIDKEIIRQDLTHLVTLVKLPTNAIEVIVNNQDIQSKIKYINETYDDNMCLIHNANVKIVAFATY